MENFVHDTIGLVHLISAIIALVTGTIIFLNTKGTTFHKRTGYIYVASMVVLNVTAFGIYHLFGGFGIFHVLAIISFVTTIMGTYPVLNRKKVKHWYFIHMKVMSWSVVGLYAAFAAEVGTRFFPREYFFLTVGVSSFLVIGVGAYFINKNQQQELKKAKT